MIVALIIMYWLISNGLSQTFETAAAYGWANVGTSDTASVSFFQTCYYPRAYFVADTIYGRVSYATDTEYIYIVWTNLDDGSTYLDTSNTDVLTTMYDEPFGWKAYWYDYSILDDYDVSSFFSTNVFHSGISAYIYGAGDWWQQEWYGYLYFVCDESTTASPTDQPTNAPTPETLSPTDYPTNQPTGVPTPAPSASPSTTAPTSVPTPGTTPSPTPCPTLSPTASPTASPTTIDNSGSNASNNNSGNSSSSDLYLTLLIIITIIVAFTVIGLIVFIQISHKKMKMLAVMTTNNNDTPGQNMIDHKNSKNSNQKNVYKNEKNDENNDNIMHEMNDRDSIVANDGASNISSHASMVNNVNNSQVSPGVGIHNMEVEIEKNNIKMENKRNDNVVAALPYTMATNENNKNGERDTIFDNDGNGIEMLHMINIDNIEGINRQYDDGNGRNENENDSGSDVEDMYKKSKTMTDRHDKNTAKQDSFKCH